MSDCSGDVPEPAPPHDVMRRRHLGADHVEMPSSIRRSRDDVKVRQRRRPAQPYICSRSDFRDRLQEDTVELGSSLHQLRALRRGVIG